jgi:hypothetical protein
VLGVASVKFAGGTLVTPYGAHNAAHAAGTCAIGVVAITEAHGPTAALGRGDVVECGVGEAVLCGAGVPHEATIAATATVPMRMPPVRTIACPSIVSPGPQTVHEP